MSDSSSVWFWVACSPTSAVACTSSTNFTLHSQVLTSCVYSDLKWAWFRSLAALTKRYNLSKLLLSYLTETTKISFSRWQLVVCFQYLRVRASTWGRVALHSGNLASILGDLNSPSFSFVSSAWDSWKTADSYTTADAWGQIVVFHIWLLQNLTQYFDRRNNWTC